MPNKYLILIACIVAYFTYSLVSYHNDLNLHIHFLNVGQGDSTLIITPSKQTVLVDGGPGSVLDYELSKYLYPLDRTIDLLILTHPHADHLSGFMKIMEDYKIQAILMSGTIYKNSLYKEFLNIVREKNIPVLIAESEKDIILDNVKIDILYPFTSQYFSSYKNLNNSSIVFQLKYNEHSVFFTGDIEREGLDLLYKYGANLKSDILKVSHHGSNTGTTEDFLQYISPETAILSYGINNKFEHPHQETINLLKENNINICETAYEDCSFQF